MARDTDKGMSSVWRCGPLTNGLAPTAALRPTVSSTLTSRAERAGTSSSEPADEDEEGPLRVQRAVTQNTQHRKVIGPTKTGRSRTVPPRDRALKALQRHRVAQAKSKLLCGEDYQDQGLIFTTGTGGIMHAENLPHRLFRQLLAEAKLPRIRLYDLRHSPATLLMSAGEHPTS